MTRPLLAITFPNHWSIKNLIHSGVIGMLQESADIQGWASADRIPHLESLCAELKLAPIQWVPVPETSEPKQLTRIRHLQKSLLFESHGLSTERILQRSQRGNRSRVQQFGSAVMRVIAKTPWADAIQAKLARRRWDLTPDLGTAFPAIPDLLFATNPVDFREDPLVKAAQSAGVPVVTMVPSWDNLSSKGVLFGDFQRVFVWNEVMQREVRKLYPSLGSSEVSIVGIPRFQAYENAPGNEVGLDPKRKTILFANTATKSFPDQPAVARHLAEALAAGEFGDAQLIVRCHPHDSTDPYDFLRTMPGVTVWPLQGCAAEAFGVHTVPPANDLEVLAQTLAQSDVCVNSASTIALDAAANDVPIVSVAYDGDRKLDYANSVQSFYDYTHQKPFIASQASVMAASRAALISAVRDALNHPSVRRDERRQLARIATPGQPATRLAIALLELVGVTRQERLSA